MSDLYWLGLIAINSVISVLAIRAAYRNGICDGACNWWLPVVQHTIREYNPGYFKRPALRAPYLDDEEAP